MLLSTAQSVMAMAEFCAPNEHDNAARFGVVMASGSGQAFNALKQNHSNQEDSSQTDLSQNEINQSGPDQYEQLQSDDKTAQTEDCADCTNCQCCTHIVLSRVAIASQFQAPYTPFINYATARLISNYSPLLRPPKV